MPEVNHISSTSFNTAMSNRSSDEGSEWSDDKCDAISIASFEQTTILSYDSPTQSTAPSRESHSPSKGADSPSEDSDSNSDSPLSHLNPPPSRLELIRDSTLELIGGRAHHRVALVVLLLIIIDGALFFLLLIGAHHMCDTPSKRNCEPRNWWYNFSIQFLNFLLTYVATVSLPWKLSHAAHLTCSRRDSNVGLDLYGQPSAQIWYHICPKRRRVIVGFLVCNSFAQFANQTCRIVFSTYQLQSTYPGFILTNAFFATSFSCGLIAAIIQAFEETALRRERPSDFPPGPAAILKRYFRNVMCPAKELMDNHTLEISDDMENPRPLSEREEKERLKCIRMARLWYVRDKTSVDIWGL